MFHFFRRYEKVFFIAITTVIIISFSFFGTYNTMGSNSWGEQVAFKAVDGNHITRSDVDEMAIFLATDNDDKLLFGGAWGPNFLNDGVIRYDFLETGLASELATAYLPDLANELNKRQEKERKYVPYTHPQAPFLGAANAWNYFVPEINVQLEQLKIAQNPQDILNAKIKLFIAERRFPSPTLKQVLRYQERQYNWLQPDRDLESSDLSLFGYHTLEDWFGTHFTRLVSQFIINASILAEQKGYEVSRTEALADLIRQAEVSYQQNKNSPTLGVRNVEEYFYAQLQRLNMDQNRAVKIWRQVMLFRNYYHDVGSIALVDTVAYQNINGFANESIEVDLYRLPSGLRIGDVATLQKFEAYLTAATKRSKTDLLAIPKEMLPVAEVSKAHPELVQKKYLLDIAELDKKTVQAKVSIKDTWSWEADEKNWTALKTQFPELGTKAAKTADERMAALDNLDKVTRARVDTFARAAIVDAHPEWIVKALDEAKVNRQAVGLRLQGGKMPFEGLKGKDKREAFIRQLDQATLGAAPAAGSELANYSADQQHYYRITVIERAATPTILTFEEANGDGSLDKISKELVTTEALDNVLKAIQKAQPNPNDKLGDDLLASLRLYAYMQQIQTTLKRDPAQAAAFIEVEKKKGAPAHLADEAPVANQWRLEKATLPVTRQTPAQAGIDFKEAFAISTNEWTAIQTPAQGNLAFFQVKGPAENSEQEELLAEQVQRTQQLLSAEAQRALMSQMLIEIKAKDAISLGYLTRSDDTAQEGIEQN